jgi:hypothetical protein
MKVTRALVLAMDSEWEHAGKKKIMQKLAREVQEVFGLGLEAFKASTEPDPTIPISPRTLFVDKSKRIESVLDIVSKGAIGCATSHIRILRSVAQAHAANPAASPNDWTAVFESDAVIGIRKGKLVNLLQDEAPRASVHPSQPSILSLFVFLSPGITGSAVPIPGFRVLKSFTGLFMSTAAYLVRNRDAQTIADGLTPIEAQVDGALGMLSAIGKIPPVWGAIPSVASIFNAQLTSIQTHVYFKPVIPHGNMEVFAVFIMPWLLFFGLLIAMCVILVKQKKAMALR